MSELKTIAEIQPIMETVGCHNEFDRSKPDGTPQKLLDVSNKAEGWTAQAGAFILTIFSRNNQMSSVSANKGRIDNYMVMVYLAELPKAPNGGQVFHTTRGPFYQTNMKLM